MIDLARVALERLELSQTEPESGVLPLHHKAVVGDILLPWKDSNSHKRNQNPVCYHYTTRQSTESLFSVSGFISLLTMQNYSFFLNYPNFSVRFFIIFIQGYRMTNHHR